MTIVPAGCYTATADAFRNRFGGELLDPRTGRPRKME
jgi:hypothetical protein